MKKITYVFLFILITGCASKHTVNVKHFSEYAETLYNQSDGITDQLLFKLYTPKEKAFIGYYRLENAYFYLVELSNDQKIIVMQLPKRSKGAALKLTNLTYAQFEHICNKENIFNMIQTAFNANNKKQRSHIFDRFMENRRFGLNKTGNGFYVIYLNAKSKNVADYNFCINSIVY